jgi:hypothetical protein
VSLRAELIEQDDPAIGDEIVHVTHEDGSTEQVRLHDYDRIYALPGVYERIVQERLGCVSPARIAHMLAGAVHDAGWAPGQTRVIDMAAGNGVSGEALVAEGLHPVLGTDIVPAAREAALRDRPTVYDEYLTLDLLALTAEQESHLRGLRASALNCVAPVGEDRDSQVPPAALLEAVRLLTGDALIVYLHDPNHGEPDVVTAELFRQVLGAEATELARERYRHRRTVSGAPFDMVGVVWRLRR